jgi:hypothetical protein
MLGIPISFFGALLMMPLLGDWSVSINMFQLQNDLNGRVGILEKWRWLIIGGAIVVGFALQKMPIWG